MVVSEANLETLLIQHCLPAAPLSMREWAEENIVLPAGPYKGEAFRVETQPFVGLFLREVDSGRWNRIAATGPSQSGKTLACYVLPVLYHLFGLGETVCAGLPTMAMAHDKWCEDFLPVIEASPALARLLPDIGEGSRGGTVKTRVKFRNGATLRFLSGGGSDKGRAGFSSRVLAVTEVDGLDESGETSREADKLSQMEARLRAFLRVGAREYLECTVSIPRGRIWQEYTHGTRSRIVRPCPKCGAWVTPEREHLVGWHEADNEEDARAWAAWACPACEEHWTEAERYEANLRAVLAHHGQEVTDSGTVTGKAPKVGTFSFRWSAVDNHFLAAGDVAVDEWKGQRAFDRENAEKRLRQFVFCIPYEPPNVDLAPLDVEAVVRRKGRLRKGIAPGDTVGVTIGVDTGKRRLHWVAIAWLPTGGGHVLEYGEQPVDAEKLGTYRGLLAALGELRNYLTPGWPTETNTMVHADQVWIDARYYEHTQAVVEYCRAANGKTRLGMERWRPCMGYGERRPGTTRYTGPKALTEEVLYIGPGYHLSVNPAAGCLFAHVNGDQWKTILHERLSVPEAESGAIVLYDSPDPREHAELVRHLAAEEREEVKTEGRGEIVVWTRLHRENHYLDAAYYATTAGDLVLALKRIQRPARPRPSTPAAESGAEREPFLVSAR